MQHFNDKFVRKMRMFYGIVVQNSYLFQRQLRGMRKGRIIGEWCGLVFELTVDNYVRLELLTTTRATSGLISSICTIYRD